MTTAAAGDGHAAACLSSKLSPDSGPNNTGSFFDSPQPSQTDVGTESHGGSQGDRSSTRESASNPRLAEETYGGSNGDRSSTNESSRTPLPEVLWGGHLSQDPWARKTILSFDGGGVRGFSSLLILKRLMYLIEQIELGYFNPDSDEFLTPVTGSGDYPWNPSFQSGDGSQLPGEDRRLSGVVEIDRSVRETFARTRRIVNFKPHHYFDYIAGTSTGGLSAIMLARLEQTVDEALEQYDVVGNQVFGKPRRLPSLLPALGHLRPKYPTRRMKRALQEVIRTAAPPEIAGKRPVANEDTLPFKSDPRRCRCLVISYGIQIDTDAEKPYLFRSYDHDHPNPLKSQQLLDIRNPGPAHQQPVWFVARATSAAPSYFRSAKLEDKEWVDGGIIANNPSYDAYEEVKQLHPGNTHLLVSIGTGKSASSMLIENRQKGPKWPLFRTIKAMKMLATRSEASHNTLKTFLQGGSDTEYCRLNVPYFSEREQNMKDMLLDEWEPKPRRGLNKTKRKQSASPAPGSETKTKMLECTVEYLTSKTVHRDLCKYAKQLVDLRRRRAKTREWEEFACKFFYNCPELSCRQGPDCQTFLSRNQLRDHGVQRHSFITTNEKQESRACIIGDCFDDGAEIFANEDQLKLHLEKRHSIQEPVFRARCQMEDWLDRGRRDTSARESGSFAFDSESMKEDLGDIPPSILGE
ncbi:acyl transferase/acyl hydrolase/lysophospholipase [Phyllosticta capitalensis]|uniref:acyl transferase/acyl hydrolase/lysophospholipase n=1 Tax=Phyllosticta capitalensis TaxID=121624 RepID=UPI00312D3942